MVKFNENKQLDNERKVRLLANTEICEDIAKDIISSDLTSYGTQFV
jgi:hypothetical protein